MNRSKNLKITYPILGSIIALCGTVALFFGLWGTWLAGCLAANVFIAAGLVCGTEIKTIRRKNPMAQFSEDEPKEMEGQMYRVPFLSVLIALGMAIVTGLLSGSAIFGLLTFFTWGGLGIPLGACVLTRTDFGLSLQTGLISSVVFTAVGGAIQIFISSPGNSFDPEYCLEAIATKLTDGLTAALTEFQTLTQSQQITLADGTELSQLFSSISAEETAAEAVKVFLSATPALYAIFVLFLLCVIWWGLKAALKKDAGVEIKSMGRLDGYRPGWILSPLYLIFFLVNLFSESGSILQIASMNIIYVVTAVLTFAGFSILLYFINTRIPSAVARVFLTIATVVVSLSSCGGSLLLLLGLFSTGRDLRGMFGGGTYR